MQIVNGLFYILTLGILHNLWHATYLKTINKYVCNYKKYIYNYQAKVASFLNNMLLQNYLHYSAIKTRIISVSTISS